MPRSIAVLAASLVLVSGCTSTAASLRAPRQSSRSSEASPVAAGLQQVKNYAQEFCSDGTPAHCPVGTVPVPLRRPLQIPSISAATPCPTSDVNPSIWSPTAPGLGPGPVAPVGLGANATLRYRQINGSTWGLQKVLWVAAPSYDGPILIRGGRIDGDGGVGFSIGSGPPLAELQLPPGSAPKDDHGGWRNWPSYTRLQAPGCYAYQVDGTAFSYTIVFRGTN